MQVLFPENPQPGHHCENDPYNRDMQRGRKPKQEAPLFGQRLAHYRTMKGLTQYEFADLLGISRNLVVHYERACENPTADFVIRAAQTLNVSIDELLGLQPQRQTKRGPSPKVQKLAERISKLPKSKQAVVIEMLEGYLDRAS
jgi:transcriptional regulator with XRE-family HTH domain